MNKLWSLKINLGSLILFVFIWVFGFYGGPISKSELLGLGISDGMVLIIYSVLTVLCSAFIYFFYYSKDVLYVEYQSNIEIHLRDIFVGLGLLALVIGLSPYALNRTLGNDEIYHAEQAHIHMMSLLSWKNVPIFENYLAMFSFKNILWIINFTIAIAIFMLLFLMQKYEIKRKVFITILAFILLRVITYALDIGGGTHPSFRLFPIWMSSSLFGMQSWAFRMPHLIAFVIFLVALKKIIFERFPISISWLCVLACATLPTFLHTVSLNEASIWTGMIWTICLAVVVTGKKVHPIFLLVLICIGGVMRTTCLFALCLMPLFYFNYLEKHESFRHFVLRAVFLLPFLLNFGKSILLGTPATYIPGESDVLLKELSTVERVWYSVRSGLSLEFAIHYLNVYYCVFLGIVITLCFFIKKLIINSFFIILLFMVSYFIFYSIRPNLWGMERYHGEFLVPFFCYAIFQTLLFLKHIFGKFSQSISRAFLFGIIAVNVINLIGSKGIKDPYFESRFIKPGYDYGVILKKVLFTEHRNSHVVLGTVYGSFLHVIEGYSHSDIVNHNRSFSKYAGLNGEKQLDQITKDKNISMIIMPKEYFENFKNKILSMNWNLWKGLDKVDHATKIIALVRK